MAPAEPELVKPAQSRRGRGSSYVTVSLPNADGPRVFSKHQTDYWCRPIWRAFRRTPLLTRELRALRACAELGINVPEVISYSEKGIQSRLELVEVVHSAPLDEALDEQGADRNAILKCTARIIGRLHHAGWSHGALYPHHILINTTVLPSATLIDLEKARRNPFRLGRDLQRFWRHAPAMSDSERAGFDAEYTSARRGG